MKKLFLAMTAAAALLSTGVSYAVPARPGMFKFTQPDGTVLTVHRIGDEFSHIVLTEDDRPLYKGADGAYYYAIISDNGELSSSGILASDAASRKAPAKSFLSQDNSADNVDAALERSRKFSRKLPQNGMGLYTSEFPTKGEIKGLVVLVEYQDVKFTIDNPKQHFLDLLNKEGYTDYGGTGSARDYFLDASTNQFQPTFDVYGPVTLPNKMSYYGENDSTGDDKQPELMAVDAAQLLDDTVDFSEYDLDNDGKIDNMYIFYAGYGESDTDDTDTVWPHSWDLSQATAKVYKYDGVRLDHYACSNELQYNNVPDGIGTFVHEFSHVMGLPDLYHTTNSSAAYTPYYWSVLDIGCYSNDGCTPPSYSSYERNAVGWVEPVLINGATSITMNPLADSNECYIVQTDTETEFFLFENRQQSGWDTYCPGHGMMIWHIDYNTKVWDANTVNNTKSHQYVDIVEANNNPAGSNSAMAGYPWPGTSKKTSFTSVTTPSFKDWNGKAIDLPITNITEKNGIISFDVAGGKFDLTAPKNLTASDITSTGFKLTWGSVDKATAYTVSIYTKDDQGNRQYEVQDLEVTETSYIATSLQAETQYFATVTATAGTNISDPSSELPIMTGDFIFNEAYPKVLPASSVSSKAFTANWNEVKYATEYLLTVTYTNEGASAEEIVDFGSSTDSYTLPDGWTTTATGVYSAAGYFGKAAPSLKMQKDGAYITTPAMDNDITAVQFWCRGANTAGGTSTITVEAYVNDAWTTLETVSDLEDSATGQTIAINDIPTGTHQVKITYNKVKGNLAIDDIVITSKNQETYAIDGYNELNVGNVTSYNVNVPFAGKFSYYVSARNAKGESTRLSSEMKVDTTTDGIEDITVSTPAGNVEYYNLQGVRVNRNNISSGLYLRRNGQSVEKVIIK